MGTKIKRIISQLFQKIRIKRTTFLALIFVLLSVILVRKLYQLQIIEGSDYQSTFVSNTTKVRELASTRGKIYDRNGELVAWNTLSYSVTIEDNGSYTSTREKNLTINSTIYKVRKILNKNGDQISTDFHIYVDENGNYAFDVDPGFTLDRFRADIFGYALIDDMSAEENTATADEIMDYLSGENGFSIVLEGDNAYTSEEKEEYGLPEELTKADILDIAMVRYQMKNNSFMKYMAVTMAEDISEVSVATIKEYSNELQGVEIAENSARQYVDEDSMGPILGYTGKASSEELSSLKKQNSKYDNSSIVGKTGIESYMELYLQGTDGQETISVDNMGKVLKIDEDTKTEPSPGNDVYLTIDTDWQSAIYQILEQRVAGIVLSKLTEDKTFDYEAAQDASQITIPIYSVYYALIDNNLLDIDHFAGEDAADNEKAIYAKFQTKQDYVFSEITKRLTMDNPPVFSAEDEEMQEYLSYICDDVLTDSLGILSKGAIDTGDATYLAWADDQSISLKEYLVYATSQNWIDISGISPEGEYLDSSEVYSCLTDYIIEYLRTDNGFSKLLYKYLLLEDTLSGSELCLALYDQGYLSKDDGFYDSLASGAMSAYNFMVNMIYTLEIEPAALALEPCSASCVVTDVNTGEVLACVSYPGYDNNRLSNDMDTDYYAKLSLDNSSPFFNKATQQRTAPGSTLKLLSTVAGMMEGVIDDNTYFNCTGSFDYVEPHISCWLTTGHGSLEIKSAIEQSCNYFFCMVGFQLGKLGDNQFSENQSLSVLQHYADLFGLDHNTGIEITESAPQVSNSLAVPSYMGQGTHLYTTTQLARYAATLANKGTVYDLSLIDKVTDASGELIKDYQPEVYNILSDVEDNVWTDIHEGMERVVATHDQFSDLGMTVAGKTGTAQVDIYHPNHALFVGYAPAADPEYAIAVRISNGYTSGNACLIADDVFKYIFELDSDENILTGFASSTTSNVSND